jgi:transposase
MKRFVEGEDRRQGVLLPEYLDEHVAEENAVRVIDIFVEELDLGLLGFEGRCARGHRPTGLSPRRAKQPPRLSPLQACDP